MQGDQTTLKPEKFYPVNVTMECNFVNVNRTLEPRYVNPHLYKGKFNLIHVRGAALTPHDVSHLGILLELS